MEERRTGQHVDSNVAMQIGSLATKVDRLSDDVSRLDLKVDTIGSKIDKSEGVLVVVRWLGVGGVTIAVVALARSFGVHV
jgi:hypothetical protein